MKKTLHNSFILLLGWGLTCFSCSSPNGNKHSENENAASEIVELTSVSQNGFLAIQGTSLVNEKGQPVILRGVSFGSHNTWPRFYNDNTVTWLKEDWKVNVIRAVVRVLNDRKANSYLQNPQAALASLYAVVDAAIKNDVYVIIDWHAQDIHRNEAIDFFRIVAEKYKDYPNIIYELFNEPVHTWGEVKKYSEAVIAAIRAIDKRNIIVIGTPTWNQDVDVAAVNPITGYANIMYSLHFYAASHKQSLRNKATAALQKGLPLFVTECAGMESSGNGPINFREWQIWLEFMNDHGISWVTCSIADKNESSSMIKDASSPVSDWDIYDLKEWGLMVREELRKNNQQL